MTVPDPLTQAEIAWAYMEVPDVPLPPEWQRWPCARLEVPDAPAATRPLGPGGGMRNPGVPQPGR